MKNLWLGLRSIGAVIAGYATIALGNILTLEVWLGGITYAESPPGDLVLATIGASFSGLFGGLVAAYLAGRRPVAHAMGVLIPLTLDTIFVLRSGISSDPLWFDLGGSLTLMLTAVAGGVLLARFRAEG